MPLYEYECDSCGHSFDVMHSMKEKPSIKCPTCKSAKTSRVYSAAGIVVKSSHAKVFVHDRMKRDGEIKAKLLNEYGVQSYSPIRGNIGIEEVYRDVKGNGSLVRDQMQQTHEENQNRIRKKHREWRREALKRTPQRAKEKKAMRQKTEAAKNVIRL